MYPYFEKNSTNSVIQVLVYLYLPTMEREPTLSAEKYLLIDTNKEIAPFSLGDLNF
jgi:hypothetical protein